MNAHDKWGLIEFKQKAKTFYLDSDDGDSKDIAKMKDAMNFILVWLSELEEDKIKKDEQIRAESLSCSGHPPY